MLNIDKISADYFKNEDRSVAEISLSGPAQAWVQLEQWK